MVCSFVSTEFSTKLQVFHFSPYSQASHKAVPIMMESPVQVEHTKLGINLHC